MVVKFKSVSSYYVECVNDNSIEFFFERGKITPIIEDRRSDSQTIRQSLLFFKELNKDPDEYTPSFKILREISQEEINEIDSIMEDRHAQGLGTGIRITNGQDMVFDYSFFQKMNNADYLFVDLGESNYKAACFFLDDIKSINSSVKVVIISSERRNKKTNKNYCEFGKEPDMNTSVLESLKNGSFEEDGLATYCGYRSTIKDIAKGVMTFGLVLLMNFDDSSFFSIKSSEYNYVGTTYAALKPKILADKDTVLGLLNENSISRELLESFLNGGKKGNAQFYIGLSMVHYVEELLYKYYRVI